MTRKGPCRLSGGTGPFVCRVGCAACCVPLREAETVERLHDREPREHRQPDQKCASHGRWDDKRIARVAPARRDRARWQIPRRTNLAPDQAGPSDSAELDALAARSACLRPLRSASARSCICMPLTRWWVSRVRLFIHHSSTVLASVSAAVTTGRYASTFTGG